MCDYAKWILDQGIYNCQINKLLLTGKSKCLYTNGKIRASASTFFKKCAFSTNICKGNNFACLFKTIYENEEDKLKIRILKVILL